MDKIEALHQWEDYLFELETLINVLHELVQDDSKQAMVLEIIDDKFESLKSLFFIYWQLMATME